MENLKKMRTPIRKAFQKSVAALETELCSENPNFSEVDDVFAILEEKVKELEMADQCVQEILLQDDAPEHEYERECEEIDSYKEKFIRIRRRVSAIYNVHQNHGRNENSHETESLSGFKKKYRMPKIEIQKFGGELKEWLCFWSLFKKYHEDDDVDPEDKFQYLLQAITPGSRARDLVESYPPTAENYPKVVESLRQRFGRDDLLVEVYVRELLRLVLQNATNPREKVTVTKLYDQLESHIRALDTLGVTSDKCAAMLFPLVESCLPEDVLSAWQRGSALTPGAIGDDPSKNRLTNLLQFLRSEVEGEERIRLARAGFGMASKKEKKTKEGETSEDVPTAAGLFAGQSPSKKKSACIFCEKQHPSQECFAAQKMTLAERKSALLKRRCCFVCLRPGHTANECKLYVKCIVCTHKHFPVMCPELKQNEQSSKKESNPDPKPALANMCDAPEVLLKTLMVKINVGGKARDARVVIDDGSHRSYILKNIAEEMHLKKVGTEPMIHALFGGVKSSPVVHTNYEVPLSNMEESYSCVLEMLDQPTICTTVPKVPRGPWLGELKQRKIWLSDVGVGCPEIEILIGADIAGRIMTGRVRHLKSGLVAVETRLGWTLMGAVPGGRRSESSTLLVTNLLNSETCISNLWKLDTLGITDPSETTSRDEMERAAKEHFIQTVKVNEEGRYEVHLPWIEAHPKLSSNRILAERRLISATNKLTVSGYMKEYEAVFQEWISLGIIEKVPEEELESFGHYLPHRAVIKTTSATTKVRPVFDASAHEKGYPSLNDCLEKGPNLIAKLLTIIICFREKRIGVVADIAKAFLQLALASRDRDFLRFLWWEDFAKKKIAVLRHKRVVFGVSSSPFLLGATIELHLDGASEYFEAIAAKLKKSFYVDNVATSVDNDEELLQFMQKAQDLMSAGKFDLRGWESTMLSLEYPDEEEREVPLLGLRWDKWSDTLRCEAVNVVIEGPVTKRKILSVSHRIFDPIGFVCPVTLFSKKLLQQTWYQKVGWDAELPPEISEKFQTWASELEHLSEVRIPRWMLGWSSERKNWTLHTFSDASKLAYAACVFLRAEGTEGVSVQLILAKSRVAPVKPMTIPRLELLSCLIGVRLAETVKKSLELEGVPSFYWSDSSTALSWISREDQWGTFIGNRVKEIRSCTEASEWRHVPGTLNPADLPSRGCSVKMLAECRWWEGPSWLKLSPEEWPQSVPSPDEEAVVAERRKTVVSMFNLGVSWSKISFYFQDISSYTKMVRRVAWYHRFFKWLKNKSTAGGELTMEEVEVGEFVLLRTVQSESYGKNPEEFVASTEIFQGEDWLVRVKTRLTEGSEPQNFKYPVLLPGNHPIVQELIRELHLQNSHCGVQVLLAILRERFWLVRARRSVRAVVSRCVRCRRFQAKKVEVVPAPLPKDRIKNAAVFEVTGVDLAGPLFLKGGKKAWIVLFTCAVYRALHLELVLSLSTEAFLMALRRFIARRGRPSVVYSDNGTNFQGAENLFRKLDWSAIEKFAAGPFLRILWKFNPPTAAWWGGWWERLVRMVKELLRRVLGKASLFAEELVTVLCDSEAVINSRPLTYVSDDMRDFSPISPSMFLQEVRESGVPDLDEVDHSSLNRRCQYVQKIREQLRKRFRTEYLGQLVQRRGNKGRLRDVAVGDIVLVGSDNSKRMDWPLAKILEVIPGRDGHVRVVRVKTATGEYLRPVQRLFPLEVSAAGDDGQELVPVPVEAEQADVKDLPKEARQMKKFVTRSGREVKSPVKFTSTSLSLFGGCYN